MVIFDVADFVGEHGLKGAIVKFELEVGVLRIAEAFDEFFGHDDLAKPGGETGGKGVRAHLESLQDADFVVSKALFFEISVEAGFEFGAEAGVLLVGDGLFFDGVNKDHKLDQLAHPDHRDTADPSVLLEGGKEEVSGKRPRSDPPSLPSSVPKSPRFAGVMRVWDEGEGRTPQGEHLGDQHIEHPTHDAKGGVDGPGRPLLSDQEIDQGGDPEENITKLKPPCERVFPHSAGGTFELARFFLRVDFGGELFEVGRLGGVLCVFVLQVVCKAVKQKADDPEEGGDEEPFFGEDTHETLPLVWWLGNVSKQKNDTKGKTRHKPRGWMTCPERRRFRSAR